MQHFLLSPAAKTLSLAQVFSMSDQEAEAVFCRVRWPDTEGKPVCPHCGGLDAYEARRPNCSLRYRCRACKKDFTLTAGTLFASHKMPLKSYLAAIAIFCNEVKGKSMLALSRDLGTSYKTAFVLAHKLREAMAAELKGRTIGGDGIQAGLERRPRHAQTPGRPCRPQLPARAQPQDRHRAGPRLSRPAPYRDGRARRLCVGRPTLFQPLGGRAGDHRHGLERPALLRPRE
jgi:transposase-like protein